MFVAERAHARSPIAKENWGPIGGCMDPRKFGYDVSVRPNADRTDYEGRGKKKNSVGWGRESQTCTLRFVLAQNEPFYGQLTDYEPFYGQPTEVLE